MHSSRAELQLTVRTPLLSLNQYIRLERTPKKGYLIASNWKRDLTDRVALEARSAAQGRSFDGPCVFSFRWFAKDARTDPDNIAFARKFLMDGIVQAGVLPDDDWSHVAAFTDDFAVDADDPRVEILIRETEDDRSPS
jgi:Holliday junction resolvase RusA-like endonuclease